ncbi:MAG TPA: glycosyltransferase family 4 protein [Nitrospira sp.]|nr:glycosyltransferase family 4 protein [Nitrospira sp.]
MTNMDEGRSKVIFVNRYFHPDFSATSQLLSDLAFHLADGSRHVHVITSRQGYDDASASWPAAENINGVHVTRVWTSSFGRNRLWGRTLDYLTFYGTAFIALLRKAERDDLIVAKTDPPLISVVASLVAAIRGARLINWIQDLFPEVALALRIGKPGYVATLLRAWRNRALHMAVKNVVLGTSMEERLMLEGLQPSKLKVIHNWADGRTLYPVPPNDNDLRRRWNLLGKVIVGYSGNLGRAHDFRTILAVAERLADLERLVFLFIGEGAQLSWMKQHVRNKALGNVIFKPYQPRDVLPLSLSVPDIHLISLQPALEGLIVPSKFYGITAVGRPILYIGSPTGEIPELIRKAGCGFVAKPGEVEQAAATVRGLCHDEKERQRLGAQARRLFDQYFDRPRALQAWETVLNEAA